MRARAVAAVMSLVVAAATAAVSTATAAPSAESCLGREATITGTDHSDHLRGTNGNDVIVAGGGNDRVSARGGNDLVCAGPGNDVVEGGDGSDGLTGEAGDDALGGGAGKDIVSGDAGSDDLSGDAGTDVVSFASSHGVHVSLAIGRATGQGRDALRSLENVIGSPLPDRLEGDDQANVLAGVSGSDELRGGGGKDTASFELSSSDVKVDLEEGTAGRDEQTLLFSIENVFGSIYADDIRGDEGPNVLNGVDGDDTIVGRGGDDVLRAPRGEAFLEGGPGDDMIDGPKTTFANAPRGVTVDLLAHTATGDGHDRIRRVTTVVGSAFDDTILGDNAPNYLDGYSGDDTIDGRGGPDQLNGDGGNDVESGGTGQDTVDGASGDDHLDGGEDNDFVRGERGNDELFGGPGMDALAGDDIFMDPTSSGDDHVDGGADEDRVEYIYSSKGVTVDLAAGTSSGQGNDTLTGIENVLGSGYDDSITGDDLPNEIHAFGGNDHLAGRGGDDTLFGDQDTDDADGGDGTDTCLVETATNCE